MRRILSVLFVFFLLGAVFAEPVRRFEGNILVSDSLPAIRIEIDPAFHFIGSFPFRIHDIAAGQRYVFVDARKEQIHRLFIAQFESFLPESTEIYRYNFDNAELMQGFRFRQNTFAFNVQDSIKENPSGEAALTQSFLQAKNYKVGDEWMASRFLTLGDESRKSEMILFYMEPVAASGHTLAEFYNGEERTALWEKISKELDARSRSAFRILPDTKH